MFFDLYYFTFLASLMAFSVPWKCRNCIFVGTSSKYSSLWLTCFPVAKMPKAQWDRDRNMDTIMEIFVAHGQSLLLYSENWSEPKKQHSCPLRWLALSCVTNTLNQWLSNYHISMISSNILSLGSFFSQNWPSDTPWFQLHYTLTP